MLEANVLDKVSPGNRGRHFLGPVYVDWPMLQSNSPESRDFIRLEVGPSLVCLAIGKFMGGFQFRRIYTLFLQGEINVWEGAGSIDFWQISLGNLSPF
jgi:hypothetical protein